MITERSGHGKSRYVFIQVPDSLWPYIPTDLIFKSLDSPTVREYARLFIRFICFVVTIQGVT